MRRRSNTHYATSVTQFERCVGGQSWANPEFALASYGNVGTVISNIEHTDNDRYPFGEEYHWGFGKSGPQSQYEPHVRESFRKPHGLRFSGFNIDDVGITGNCRVVNLYLHLEYTDNTIQHNFQTIQVLRINGSNWLANIIKADGTVIAKKRFDGVSCLTPYVSIERIPFMRDQCWGTNTYASWIDQDTKYYQRWVIADPNYYDDDSLSGKSTAEDGFRKEYFEPTHVIFPDDTSKYFQINDINDPGFHIDLWYGKFFNFSGIVKVKSLGLSVEYIKPYRRINRVLSGRNADKPQSIIRTDRNSIAFTNPDAGGLPVQSSTNNYASLDICAKPTGNVSNPFDGIDSNILLSKFESVPDLIDTEESISDMIIDFRVHHWENFVFNSLPFWGLVKSLKINWGFSLYDGYLSGYQNPPSGTTIWKHCLTQIQPGLKRDFNATGQEWLNSCGGWNDTTREYFGPDPEYNYKDLDINYTRFFHGNIFFNRYITPYNTLPFHAIRFPVRRYDSNYVTETINSSYYPGMTYDPLWIEKALKAGKLFIGIRLASKFRPFYFNVLQSFIPQIRWRFKFRGISARIYYNQELPVAPTGPTGSNPEPFNPAALLYRHTP